MLERFRDNIQKLFASEEVNEVYLTQALRAFSFALIGIYVPLHLYELGFSLQITGLLFASYGFMRAAFTPVTVWLVSLYGPKHIMSVSQILSVGFLLLLTMVETSSWVVVPALVL
jgi:MFS family permease